MQSNNGPILMIDALNLFSRHYIRNPALTSNGAHAGGVIGFMSGLKYLINMAKPSAVYIAWEGGGSARRRAIFPEYKANRKPPKLNRYYEDEIPDSAENRVHQIQVLVGLLKHTPLCQIYVEDCEADDVIGYLCRNKFRDQKKIIASSDKDFYQLLDENTLLYSWTKKMLVSVDDVISEYGITAQNFAVAKAFVGDSSDNVPGVNGVGFKTLAKRFPVLSSRHEVSVADIIAEAKNLQQKKLKTIDRINSSTDLINRNWKLMYLDISNLAAMQVRKIEATVDNFKHSKDKISFMKGMVNEGLPTFDAHDFFSVLTAL